ncbi:NAD(P)H-dependent oxidoreductase [Actinoplanes sp. TRM 88003]|uniref:NAD(P)H-dependent oxidoreductase n=1 Tax=Paractinoplanes aksuensis TaxID=2939490 RepID=A0ABT1DFA9_9ACTN|nr:NAD(P)H-dependent oxidoreductase [Actinoplanes aksuensis]MCO8269513.1 NAD(P)H-dependent oxidoreductase [Actinoplanes aksuensis]
MTLVHIVYAHPAPLSFTRDVFDAFRRGLSEAGHTATVSDLCAMGFRAEMSLEEYERESAYAADRPVAPDVRAEQQKLLAADVWAFFYPMWWADCPAILKGWFDRVWTAGFAHRADPPVRVRRALVCCTAGYEAGELERSGVLAAMRTTMLTDRIGDRAETAELLVLGGTAPEIRETHLRTAFEAGLNPGGSRPSR